MPAAVSATMPGLVVGGTASHSGKTLTTLALICALRARDFRVAAAKIGPDFIDTAYHQYVSGLPVANLDLWMHGRRGLDRLRERMVQRAPDVCVAEGVMGLFDGTARGRGSTADVAKAMNWPVLLVLPCKGMAQSVAAVAEGFLLHDQGGQREHGTRFAGMVCTFVGGPRHQALLREALAPVVRRHKVPLLGMLPREGAPTLPSRHLGLVAAEEMQSTLDPQALAAWFAANCDVDALLRRLGVRHGGSNGAVAAAASADAGHPPVTHFFQAPTVPHTSRRALFPVRVGIAHDAAFRFCYADLPAFLQELGAEPHLFSPMNDTAPPPCDALYFPGGYPELYARELSANTSMLGALRQLAQKGLPMYGECGGFIYMMRELVDHDGARWPMAGLLPLSCRMGSRWAALGYRLCEGKFRGHEFHYGEIRVASEHIPLWYSVRDGSNNELGPQGCRHGAVCGSWIHLAPEGARPFWRAWLRGK